MTPTATACLASALSLVLASPLAIAPPFTAGESPEGIAFDRIGNLYVSNRHMAGGFRVSEILHVSRDGRRELVATLDPAVAPAAPGVLGLATDDRGNVYAALASFNLASHGVWRVDPRDGSRERLAGSEGIQFPNALTFDPRGNLYVSDSAGAIWRFPRQGDGTIWIQDALLAPTNPQDPLLPPVGANGIAFAPPNLIYVANTQRGLIAQITIGPDGHPGPLQVVAQSFTLLTIDGIAVDVLGRIYGVVPGSAALGTHPLVTRDKVSGAVHSIAVDPTVLDTPLSIVLGTGSWDHQTLFITNGDLPIVPGGPGPGIVSVSPVIPHDASTAPCPLLRNGRI